MLNVYNGNVTTDERAMPPSSFRRISQALNRDFRYQLTPIGAQSWDVRVGVWREIADNRFTIRSSARRRRPPRQVVPPAR